MRTESPCDLRRPVSWKKESFHGKTCNDPPELRERAVRMVPELRSAVTGGSASAGFEGPVNRRVSRESEDGTASGLGQAARATERATMTSCASSSTRKSSASRSSCQQQPMAPHPIFRKATVPWAASAACIARRTAARSFEVSLPAVPSVSSIMIFFGSPDRGRLIVDGDVASQTPFDAGPMKSAQGAYEGLVRRVSNSCLCFRARVVGLLDSIAPDKGDSRISGGAVDKYGFGRIADRLRSGVLFTPPMAFRLRVILRNLSSIRVRRGLRQVFRRGVG